MTSQERHRKDKISEIAHSSNMFGFSLQREKSLHRNNSQHFCTHEKMFSSCLNFLKRSTLGKCTFFSLWAWKQHINHIRTSSSVGHGPQIIVIFSRSRNASWTTNQCFLSPRWLKHVANFISHYFFLFFQFPSTISDVVFMKESRSSLTKNWLQNVSLLWNGHLKM